MEGNITDFCIICDKGIIEITANNDIIYAVFEVAYKSVNNQVVIISETLEEIRIFEIL
jgi:fructan beta-fructosidase